MTLQGESGIFTIESLGRSTSPGACDHAVSFGRLQVGVGRLSLYDRDAVTFRSTYVSSSSVVYIGYRTCQMLVVSVPTEVGAAEEARILAYWKRARRSMLSAEPSWLIFLKLTGQL